MSGFVEVVMKRLLRSYLAVVLFMLATVGAAWAQQVGGSQIAGVVKDSSGGILPGAEVTVKKTDTGMVRTVFTGSDGTYTIPNLPVGPYEMKVVLQGFNTYVKTGIVLQVNTNPAIDVTMGVGSLDETVTVTADTVAVETKSTGVGQVINNQTVVEMPLNGRQATELIFLSGLSTPAPAGDLNTNKNYPTVTISVAGGLANGMAYIMDGGTHNDPFNNLNLPTLFPDALQEFKVESSALPARYGHHAASAVNIVTKSGSNTVKGNVFEFLRDYHFNARNAFATSRDSLKRNQFGGTIGAPIKTDKLFMFAAFQGKIEKSNPPTTISYVPTQAMLNGDFTTFASPACNAGRQITLKGPYVGNQIDPASFNTVAKAFLKYVPVSTDPCGKLQYGIPNDNTEQQAMAKLDYNLSQNQTITTRYMFAHYNNPSVFDGKNVLTMSRTGQTNTVHSVVLGHNYVLGSNAVNALHVTFNRTINDRTMQEYFTPKDLGSNVYSAQPGFMGINVSGGFSIGGGGTNPGFFNSKSFQVADDFDLIRGRHQFSVGANWIHTSIETVNNRPTNGQFSINGSVTGLGLADFMVGAMGGAFVQGNAVWDFDYHDYLGAYVQDDWKVRSNLTFNFGIRWEPYIPLKNTKGYASQFDMARFDAGTKSTAYPLAPAGLMFTGDSGYPGKQVMNGNWKQFAPRAGMIWSPGGDGKTSVRAAWGIFYDTPHLFFNTRWANNPPWGAQVTVANTAINGMTDPWSGYPGGNPWPTLQNGWATAPFPAFGVYVNSPLDIHNPALQQWNVSLQRQLGDWLFGLSYLGNHMSHVWMGTELNPAVYAAGATTGNTNQRRVLYLKNAAVGQYYGTIGQLIDTGKANYNGLLVTAQRRLKNGWSVMANWTLSKCMSDPATTELTGPTIVDPSKPGGDYSYCDSDRRHVFNLSMVATTPKFNGVAGAIVGDWQVAPIVRWQSGNRSTVTLGVDRALTGLGGQRAVLVSGADPYGDGTAGYYLNPASFTSPDLGTYSTMAPFTILNPSRLQNDLAISRTFKFGGARALQIRWEIFNVINKVNLNGPTTALNSATFGKITSAGDPRIMQVAVKFAF
jgi:hypothetical protein